VPAAPISRRRPQYLIRLLSAGSPPARLQANLQSANDLPDSGEVAQPRGMGVAGRD
jgi:hypothetical protein